MVEDQTSSRTPINTLANISAVVPSKLPVIQTNVVAIMKYIFTSNFSKFTIVIERVKWKKKSKSQECFREEDKSSEYELTNQETLVKN